MTDYFSTPETMLAILVPSRGRPRNLARLVAAIADTANGPHQVWARIDDDDPRRYEPLDGVTYLRGPRIRFVASVNELADAAIAAGATHLAILGDDVVPETVGWDETLIAALRGRIGVAYGSDGLEHLHGADLPTHVVVPAELFRRLGWVALPALRHLFCDNVWRELGNAVNNLVYRPDVKLTHLHRWNRKAPDDRTYREANDKRARAKDRDAFEAWRRDTLPELLEVLQG